MEPDTRLNAAGMHHAAGPPLSTRIDSIPPNTKCLPAYTSMRLFETPGSRRLRVELDRCTDVATDGLTA
jgi:hypothetical protein